MLPRKQPVLLRDLERAQISLFSISYTWYIPSLLTPGKATAQTSPQGRKRSFQSSLGFPRGCQCCAPSRCTPSCWAGQYRTGHLRGKEKHLAQLEQANGVSMGKAHPHTFVLPKAISQMHVCLLPTNLDTTTSQQNQTGILPAMVRGKPDLQSCIGHHSFSTALICSPHLGSTQPLMQ